VNLTYKVSLHSKYQRISPGPRHMYLFHNSQFLQWGIVSTLPNPQAGRWPLVGHLQLLIQYICSYHPYGRPFPHSQLEDVPCHGDRDPLIMVDICGLKTPSSYSLCRDFLLYVLFVGRKLVR